MNKLVLICLVTLAACKNKESTSPEPVKLDPFGVQLDLPGTVKVQTSDLDGSVTISGRAFGEIFVEIEKTATTPEDLQKSEPGKQVTNFKAETLADGFAATFDYAMGETKASSVAVHRAIGGKHFRCAANSTDKQWLQVAMTACKSLRT